MILVIKPILLELSLFLGGCSLLLLNVFRKLSDYIIGLFCGLLITCFAIIVFFPAEGLFYHNIFFNSSFTQLIKASVILITFFYMVTTSQFTNKYLFNKGEHNLVIIFMIIGICLMISSNHFIMLYISMEIQALSAYTLTAMLRKSEYSAEAGVKYFILGSFVSVIYLFGVSYVYGASGTLYMHEISIKVGSQIEVLGFILILSAFLFKVGLFPFHQWVPDIYQGASTPSTTILSTLAKLGAVGVLLRLILGPFYISFQVLSLQDILSWIAASSMLIGAVLPITQTHLKRLLGYSTIGHAGFLIMGLWEVNSESVAAIIAYLLVYSLTLMMTFVCIMSLEDKGNISENCNDLGLMQLKGLSQIRPKHAFILSVCFLSMAGVPPLIGFFPKLLILKHVINKEGIFLASAAILSTVVSLFYYLKLIKLMYMDIPTRQVIGTKVNKKIWIIFLPMLFIQILGCYVPILQVFYKQCIVRAVTSLFIGYNEKNYP